MMDVKCAQCGFVNLVADEACKACGFELQRVPFYREAPPEPEADYQTGPPRLYNDVIPSNTGAGELIGTSLGLFKDNFWLVTKIVFVVMAPFEVLRALSEQRMNEDPQLAVGIFTLQLFSNVLIVPALFYALMKVMETGTAPGVNEAYRWGLSKIPKLALAAFISWLLAMGGFMLCIIPGIIVSLALFVVYPVAVFENGSAIDALKRSSQLTRGRRWDIFGASFVVGLVIVLAAIPSVVLPAMLAFDTFIFLPLTAVTTIFHDIVTEAGTILTLVTYLSILRALESGR